MSNETEDKIKTCISTVIDLFKRTPHVFLTEEDLRFHLCNQLLQHFGTEERTEDGSTSISLHTEIRWYKKQSTQSGNPSQNNNNDLSDNDEEKKNTRSDIVLIDVSTLKVLTPDGPEKLPSKSYGFNVPKAIIELKLRRINDSSNANLIRKINADILKLRKLKQYFDYEGFGDISYWLVVLDKKGDVESKLQKKSESKEIRLHYISSSTHCDHTFDPPVSEADEVVHVVGTAP